MRQRSKEYYENNNKGNLRRYHERYKNNPEHVKNAYRYSIKKHYNLSEEDYTNLFTSQEGLCLICTAVLYNPFDRKEGLRPQVDHCHRTNKVRGLLCQTCNTGLGSFKDNEELLLKGAEYLAKSRIR